MTELAIYGAGGFACEVAWLADECASREGDVIVRCFIDDAEIEPGKLLNGIPVLRLEEARTRYPRARVVAAVGDCKARSVVTQRAADTGFEFAGLIHPSVLKSKSVEIGEGAVICAGTIITTNIRIGRHVHLNLDCTLGHDVILGDFTTLAPGVHVSGWVHIGKSVYIGTGAVIINGTQGRPLVIGDGALVGAGACVTKSVAASTKVVGVPAKELVKSESTSAQAR